jgi:uncharacterized protein YktA (UPF0223 family)
MTSIKNNKQKKIIVYGVRCDRWNFERLLKNNYTIIGYSDADTEYAELKEYDYKPFIQIKELRNVEFDYIVILHHNPNTTKLIYNNLVDNGVSLDKILEYCHLGNGACDFRNPIKEYEILDRPFEGMVFGMSHSHSGFIAHWFSKQFFKFSSPSMDLFYHYNILQHLKNNNKNIYRVQYFVFEFPYYIFNFDLSKCTNECKSRLNYFEIINDYHHYGINDEQKRYIHQYKLFKDMLIHEHTYNHSSNNFEKKHNRNKYVRPEDAMYAKGHVWYKINEDTIEENIGLWKKILLLIKEINQNAKIAVVVFPHNHYSIKCHTEAIEKMKDLFYNCLNIKEDEKEILKFKLHDYYQWSKDETDFLDECHLFGDACKEFSLVLNEEFEKGFY